MKRIKIGDKAWRAQRVHVHGPKESQAHSLCGVPDEMKAQHEQGKAWENIRGTP